MRKRFTIFTLILIGFTASAQQPMLARIDSLEQSLVVQQQTMYKAGVQLYKYSNRQSAGVGFLLGGIGMLSVANNQGSAGGATFAGATIITGIVLMLAAPTRVNKAGRILINQGKRKPKL